MSATSLKKSTRSTRLHEFKLPNFSSEKTFQQAMAGLLSRMPGISRVQMLHSAQELGKDIIFQAVGPLGEPLQCACVIKNHKISGRVTSSGSTRSVLFQIEQALDTPFWDGSGAQIRVHRVYVVSPEIISQSAMQSIAGKLSERAGQVNFMGGDQVFQLLRLYWIDFFADEYSSIESHIESLARDVSNVAITSAAANYNLGPVSNSESTIYVQRTLSRNLKVFSVTDIYHLVDSAWKTEWKRTDLDSLNANISTLKQLILYLSAWGFFQVDSAKGDASFLNSLDKFYSKIQDKWQRVAEKADNSGATSGVVVTFSDQDSLEHEFSKLLDGVNRGLTPLRNACIASSQISIGPYDVSILSNSDWRLTSALNDCARYSPIDILSPRREVYIEFDESELLSYPGPLLIVGAAGYGKTSLCRWNALADAELFRRGETKTIPVYVQLNAIDGSRLGSFEDAFLATAGKSALLAEGALRQATGLRLYLDGLDEVPSASQRKSIIDLIKKGPTSRELKVQILITARDYIVGKELSDIARIELSPLPDEQIEDLISQWFRLSPSTRVDFERQLTNTPSLQSLMRIPLLATLTLLVFRQTGRLPESRTRLYSIFVELLSGGWDLAKGTLRYSKFGQTPKIMILGALASKVHTKRLRYFSASEIIDAAESTLRSSQINYHEVTEELIMDGVIAQSGASYFFSHLSFQEFLTAREFRGDPQSIEVNRALKKYSSGDEWWREVLRFYIGLAENPGKIAQWVLKADVRGDTQTTVCAWIKEFFPSYDIDAFLADNLGIL